MWILLCPLRSPEEPGHSKRWNEHTAIWCTHLQKTKLTPLHFIVNKWTIQKRTSNTCHKSIKSFNCWRLSNHFLHHGNHATLAITNELLKYPTLLSAWNIQIMMQSIWNVDVRYRITQKAGHIKVNHLPLPMPLFSSPISDYWEDSPSAHVIWCRIDSFWEHLSLKNCNVSSKVSNGRTQLIGLDAVGLFRFNG